MGLTTDPEFMIAGGLGRGGMWCIALHDKHHLSLICIKEIDFDRMDCQKVLLLRPLQSIHSQVPIAIIDFHHRNRKARSHLL